MRRALEIAAGIVIAAIILWVAATAYLRHELEVATRTINEQAVQAQIQHRERYQRQVAEQRERDQARARAEAQRLRDTHAAALRIQQLETRKAEAWAAFYKPTSKCLDPASDEAVIECGNAHIRAKREYEQRWEQGEWSTP